MTAEIKDINELIPDLPKGPLDFYRNSASICWKKLKLFIDPPRIIEYKNELYKVLEEEPVFQHSDHDCNLEEYRHETFLKAKEIKKLLNSQEIFQDELKPAASTAVLGGYDWSLLTRKSLLFEFIQSAIIGLGTERHMHYLQKLEDFEIGGTFCLTEIGHGSNTKGMRTEARYDISTNSFILHTPDFEAAKCWAGNLGKTASHAVVFAQLYTPDGNCHGLHAFFIPIRNPKTLNTYTGITIMDMGHKIGLNGVDNGVMMFDHYSVPRECLLNKMGDVTPEGIYKTPYKDPNKRFGASLGNLSMGRVGIISFASVHLSKALTIAIRYSAIRKQFGPMNNELPIIEYPLQQCRLFPYLASLYAIDKFSKKFASKFNQFRMEMFDESGSERMAMYGQEVHALSSAGKPFSGWLSRDAIQECREACGGHGYLSASGFGVLRNDNDANCTYEGDNNVLIQQTSNWLMGVWRNRHDSSCKYPMGTIDYMEQCDTIRRMKWSTSPLSSNSSNTDIIEVCKMAFEWLVCYLCEESANKFSSLKKSGMNNFSAQNNIQMFMAHTLSLAYVENVIMRWFCEDITNADVTLQPVLYKLCALFGLKHLTKHIEQLYKGELLNSGNFVSQVHEHIIRLCAELKPEALALVDAYAPPDFILHSVLGKSDGKVYQHLKTSMLTVSNSMCRPKKWQEMSYKVEKSKL